MNEVYKLYVLVMGKDFDGSSRCYWMFLAEYDTMRKAIKGSRLYQYEHHAPADTFRVDYWLNYDLIYSRSFEIQASGYRCELHKRFYEVSHE